RLRVGTPFRTSLSTSSPSSPTSPVLHAGLSSLSRARSSEIAASYSLRLACSPAGVGAALGAPGRPCCAPPVLPLPPRVCRNLAGTWSQALVRSGLGGSSYVAYPSSGCSSGEEYESSSGSSLKLYSPGWWWAATSRFVVDSHAVLEASHVSKLAAAADSPGPSP